MGVCCVYTFSADQVGINNRVALYTKERGFAVRQINTLLARRSYAAPRHAKRPGRRLKAIDANIAPPQGAEVEEAAALEAVLLVEEAGDEPASETSAIEAPPAEAARAETPQSDEPSNFLGMYFRDLGRLAVLQPREEFESASKLEALEVAVWVRLLHFRPMVDYLLTLAERVLDNSTPEFRNLRHALKSGGRRPNQRQQEKFERAVLKVSQQLYVLDADKLALQAALSELKKIYRGLPERQLPTVLTFSPRSLWRGV